MDSLIFVGTILIVFRLLMESTSNENVERSTSQLFIENESFLDHAFVIQSKIEDDKVELTTTKETVIKASDETCQGCSKLDENESKHIFDDFFLIRMILSRTTVFEDFILDNYRLIQAINIF